MKTLYLLITILIIASCSKQENKESTSSKVANTNKTIKVDEESVLSKNKNNELVLSSNVKSNGHNISLNLKDLETNGFIDQDTLSNIDQGKIPSVLKFKVTNEELKWFKHGKEVFSVIEVHGRGHDENGDFYFMYDFSYNAKSELDNEGFATYKMMDKPLKVYDSEVLEFESGALISKPKEKSLKISWSSVNFKVKPNIELKIKF